MQKKIFVLALSLSLVLSNPVTVKAEDDFLDNIDDISFEDLSNVVTSVSKKPERAFEAASAIHVITDEDIRRMGALSIPEALRGVPGIQVSTVSSKKWAVSSRGFSANLANKLLVLIDGRSVYTPTFSGVYWDVQDYPLEDIKRIEVIRGPGAALWGANAVNGVINIITKRSVETQGTLLSGVSGTQHIGQEGVMRYGGKINDNVHYRIYAKGRDKEDIKLSNGEDSYTSWEQIKTGFRIDAEAGDSINFTLQGDVYHTDSDRRTIPVGAAPQPEVYHTDNNGGGNILARWQQTLEGGSNIELQTYFDSARRDHILLEQARNTFDIDFQHNLFINPQNDFTWGLNFRHMLSKFENSANYVFNSTKRTDTLYSMFVQNKYEAIPDKLSIVLGSKIEHNGFTGIEIQPNARFSWKMNQDNTLWGALSKSVRTPSIAEEDIVFVNSPSGFGGVAKLVGNEEYDSERLTSYEIGYRSNLNKQISIDSSIFYNEYDSLFSLGSPVVDGVDLLIGSENNGNAKIYGFELAGTYNINDDLWVEGSYSLISLDFDIDSTHDANAGRTPSNQIGAKVHYNITKQLEWNNTFYYSDNLSSISVPSYTRYDTHITWKPKDGVELSLVGQNLFDNGHIEYTASGNTNGVPVEVESSIYGKVTFRF